LEAGEESEAHAYEAEDGTEPEYVLWDAHWVLEKGLAGWWSCLELWD